MRPLACFAREDGGKDGLKWSYGGPFSKIGCWSFYYLTILLRDDDPLLARRRGALVLHIS